MTVTKYNLHMNEMQEDNYDSFTDFMQGVTDDQKIFNLTPLQIGVLEVDYIYYISVTEERE